MKINVIFRSGELTPQYRVFHPNERRFIVLMTRMLVVILVGILITSCGGVVIVPPPQATATPTSTPTPTPQAVESPPPFPQTADEAASVFGVSNNDAQLSRAAQGAGWHTKSSVRLKVYKNNCIDVPAGASSTVIQGKTAWTYSGRDHDRVLMASTGSVTGPTTVYWGYCSKA